VVGLDDLSAGALANLANAPEVDIVEGDLRDAALVERVAAGCRAIRRTVASFVADAATAG